jgi:hypothetical protein
MVVTGEGETGPLLKEAMYAVLPSGVMASSFGKLPDTGMVVPPE